MSLTANEHIHLDKVSNKTELFKGNESVLASMHGKENALQEQFCLN